MLYLVGGTSRAGKTMVSRRLLQDKGIPYLPLDAVVMGFTNGFPPLGIHDKLFPNEIAEKMWPFTKAMCESLIYMGHDYAVEGEAILPKQARELLQSHDGNIRACFLGYADATLEQKVSEIKTHKGNVEDWLSKESDHYIADHIKNMIAYSQTLRDRCHTHQVRYMDVSHDFNNVIDKTVRFLLDPPQAK